MLPGDLAENKNTSFLVEFSIWRSTVIVVDEDPLEVGRDSIAKPPNLLSLSITVNNVAGRFIKNISITSIERHVPFAVK